MKQRRSSSATLTKLAVLPVLAAAAAMSAAGQNPREWRDYGGGPDNSKFSTLKQIDKSNVSTLEVAWTYPYGETGFNPIVAHGVVYAKGRNSSLVALDAATGKEIWIHEGLQGMTRRGMNYWESKDGKDRRLIFSISDYLQEIDAATGKSIRTFGNNGVVDLREGLGRDPATIGRIQSNTPGKVFENLVILSARPPAKRTSRRRAICARTTSSPASSRGSSTPSRIRANSATRPGRRTRGNTSAAPIPGAKSRSTPSAASPTSPRARERSTSTAPTATGMNLFANCLLALDARTGKRLWHFQNVHHDLWDYDNTSAPQLTTIRQDGKTVDVVAPWRARPDSSTCSTA